MSEDSPPKGSASVGKLVGSIPLPSNTASMKRKAERVQGPQRASLPYPKALSYSSALNLTNVQSSRDSAH